MSGWKVLIDRAPGVERQERCCDNWRVFEKDLTDLMTRAEGVILVLDNSGDYMLFGAEKDVACIQFCPYDKPSTPFEDLRSVMWVVDETERIDEFVEFKFGSTATEIPRRYCISPSLLIPVGKTYFEKNRLSESVTWEEE